jgi:hypothetical protein
MMVNELNIKRKKWLWWLEGKKKNYEAKFQDNSKLKGENRKKKKKY